MLQLACTFSRWERSINKTEQDLIVWGGLFFVAGLVWIFFKKCPLKHCGHSSVTNTEASSVT